jgi:hypothetical protein
VAAQKLIAQSSSSQKVIGLMAVRTRASSLPPSDRRLSEPDPSNDLLSAFNQKFDCVEQILELGQNQWDQIAGALEICDFLSETLEFQTYLMIHRRCLAYLCALVTSIRNAVRLSGSDFSEAFRTALLYKNTVSRVYVSLVIACGRYPSLGAREASNLGDSINDPLHRFLFHFSVLFLYPFDYPDFDAVAFNEFGRMSGDILDLVNHYPTAGEAVCDLLDSAMKSIVNWSVYHATAIEAIVESAIQISCRDTAISLCLIYGLVSNLEKDHIAAILPLVAKFFLKVEATERVVELVHFCVSSAGRLIDAIQFAVQIPCAAKLSDGLFRKALNSKDLEGLRVLLEKWPRECFLTTAFLHLGVPQFSEVCPPLPTELLPVLFCFLEQIKSPVPVDNLRRVLSPLLVNHDDTLEHLLIRVIQEAPYEADAVQALFAAPFEFLTSELLATVVAIVDFPFDILVDFLDRAKSVASSVRVYLLCGGWKEGTDVAVLMEHMGDGLDEDDFAAAMRLVSRIECNEDVCRELFERCIGRQSLLGFLDFLSVRADGNDLATQAMQKLLCLDEQLDDFSDRLTLYFECLRIVLKTDLPFDRDIVMELICVIEGILDGCQKLTAFPVAPEITVGSWREVMATDWNTENIARYKGELQRITRLLM